MTTAAPSMFSRVRGWLRASAKIEGQPTIASVSRAGRELRVAMARYEAGRPGGLDRSWLPGYVQDARQDITPGERLEMVRKARYFERNSAAVQKILDLIEVNVVGSGISITPAATGSGLKDWTPERVEEWRTKALARWQKWTQFADISSRQSFETLQALMARAQAVDGEIFVWLTWGDPDETGYRWPRIQLIETHRVCDAKLPRQFREEGYTQYDGILTDGRGRPVFYIVTNDNDAFSKDTPRSVALVPASEMVHVFEPSRTSQPRGITLFHAVLHDIHDLDDLQQFEMLASKDAASRANIIKTKSGELPDDGTVIGRTETVTNPDGTLAEKVTYYQRTLGGKTTVLQDGDDYQQAPALRPTAAQQEFWKILERKMCRGVGISYAAFCDYEGGWGGPALRGAIAADNRFYDVRTQTLAVCFGRIWEHVVGADVKPGGALYPPPPDWREITCHSPRRSTVDVGRESSAMLNELRVGARTFRDVLGEVGLDWREHLKQRLIEQKYLVDTAKTLGLPAGSVLSMLGAANNTNVFGEKAAEAVDGPADDAGQQPSDQPTNEGRQ